MSVSGIELRGDGVEVANENTNFINGPVILCYGSEFQDPRRAFQESFSTVPEILTKIDSIEFIGKVDPSHLAAVFPRMTSLTSVAYESLTLSEEGVLELIQAAPFLQELKLKCVFTEWILETIVLPVGPAMRTLAICTSNFHLEDDKYELIAEHCPNLTTFHVTKFAGYHSSKLYLPHDGLEAIAASCTQLQDVTVLDNTNSDAFLLLFAEHCPDLRKIHFSTISDAALDALACNCPQLRDISGVWAVKSIDTIHRAAPWLAKLTAVNVGELCPTQDTLSVALTHLRDVESLDIWGDTPLRDDQLATLALHWTRLRECFIDSEETSLGSSVAAIARNNPRLESLYLSGVAWITDDVVQAIGESCPHLRILRCIAGDLPSAFLTDRAVVRLAQGCPKLRQFAGCSGPGMTDVSVLALAQHCRHLERVDLYHATRVTEGALVRLIERAALLTSVDKASLYINKDALGTDAYVRIQQVVLMPTNKRV